MQTIKQILDEYRKDRMNKMQTPAVEISDLVAHAKKLKDAADYANYVQAMKREDTPSQWHE